MVSAVSSTAIPVNRLIAEFGNARIRSADGTSCNDCVDPVQAASASVFGKSELTEEERRQIEDLRRVDAEVRGNEPAQLSTAEDSFLQAALSAQSGTQSGRYIDVAVS